MIRLTPLAPGVSLALTVALELRTVTYDVARLVTPETTQGSAARTLATPVPFISTETGRVISPPRDTTRPGRAGPDRTRRPILAAGAASLLVREGV